jgi:hypothetical protein
MNKERTSPLEPLLIKVFWNMLQEQSESFLVSTGHNKPSIFFIYTQARVLDYRANIHRKSKYLSTAFQRILQRNTNQKWTMTMQSGLAVFQFGVKREVGAEEERNN